MEAAVNQLSAGTKQFSHLQLVRFQLTVLLGRLNPKLFTKLFAFLDVLYHLEAKKVKLKIQIEIRSIEHLKIED